MADSADIVSTLRRWTIEKALPLWSTNGFDAKRGGFQERLNPDGSPDLTVPRRLRVQARQIYVYAHAAALGWFPDARRFMLDGVCIHGRALPRRPTASPAMFRRLRRTIPSPIRCATLTIICLFCSRSAWAAKVSGDAQIRAHLDEALAFIDDHLTARDGSFIEGIPASQPRRQNPHMHAFEAMLAMHETVAHPQAMARAQKLLAMMNDKFFDPKTRTLGEYFTDAWTAVPGAAGDCVEPGHQAEWAWLLRKHERLCGLPAGDARHHAFAIGVALERPENRLPDR